jgi:PEP-CTERM motif
MLGKIKFAACVLAATFVSASAYAFPIVGTGQGVTPGNNEPVWLVIPNFALTVVSNECCFGGAWVNPVGLTANWITPFADSPGNTLATNDPNANNADAIYLYSLPGFDNPNRDVTINWASDNSADFFFNNEVIPRQSTGTLGFQSLSSFTIPAGDFTAFNTFVVRVTNEVFPNPPGNPTGLFVDVGQAAAIPEPATLALVGLGLLGFGWMMRRRRDS